VAAVVARAADSAVAAAAVERSQVTNDPARI
jgi:hypothetical protein